MLKVEVEEDRFYESRHDAKLASSAVHGGRSAGMVREEGSVHLRPWRISSVIFRQSQPA